MPVRPSCYWSIYVSLRRLKAMSIYCNLELVISSGNRNSQKRSGTVQKWSSESQLTAIQKQQDIGRRQLMGVLFEYIALIPQKGLTGLLLK